MLSVNSLAFRAGGLLASLGAGALAEHAGTGIAFAAGAVIMAAAAPLYPMSARASQRREAGTS